MNSRTLRFHLHYGLLGGPVIGVLVLLVLLGAPGVALASHCDTPGNCPHFDLPLFPGSGGGGGSEGEGEAGGDTDYAPSFDYSPGAEAGAFNNFNMGKMLDLVAPIPKVDPNFVAAVNHVVEKYLPRLGNISSVSQYPGGTPPKPLPILCGYCGGGSPPVAPGTPSAAKFPTSTTTPIHTDLGKTTNFENVVGDDPVNLANGELVVAETDLAFPGFGVPYVHRRIYRSRIDYDGPLGFGWDHSLNQRLVPSGSTTCSGELLYMTGEGSVHSFKKSGETDEEITYESPPGIQLALHGTKIHKVFKFDITKEFYVVWTLRDAGGVLKAFNELGLLMRIDDLNKQGLSLQWEEVQDEIQDTSWRLKTVTDSVGRVIEYRYNDSGRLQTVVEPESGSSATYHYDEHGDLRQATSASGHVQLFDYDGGWSTERPEYVPEGRLQKGCELACAPLDSSCDAGGVCDSARAIGLNACGTQCTSCVSGCVPDCKEQCANSDEVRTLCLEGDEDAAGCDELCGDGTFTNNYATDNVCDQEWQGVCSRGFELLEISQRCYGAAERICSSLEFSAESCRDCVMHGTHCYAGGSCNAGRECINDAYASWMYGKGYRSINTTEWQSGTEKLECEETNTGDGCVKSFPAACERRCKDGCVMQCRSGCAASCRDFCETECDPSGCALACLSIDYVGICRQSCVPDCIAQERERGPARGPKYGYLRDLNHNLLRATDGNGTVFLNNQYGEDITHPSFDAVIAQENGNGVLEFHYRDLLAEETYQPGTTSSGLSSTLPLPGTVDISDSPLVTNPPVLLPSIEEELPALPVVDTEFLNDPTFGYVDSRSSFETVDICPAVCGAENEFYARTEFVPWSGGLLVVEGMPGRVGGFSADFKPTMSALAGSLGSQLLKTPVRVPPPQLKVTVPPTVFTFSPSAERLLARASSLEWMPVSGTITFSTAMPKSLGIPGGMVRMTRRGTSTDFDVTCNPKACEYLRQVEETTLLTTSGGKLVMYPHRPMALLSLSSGTCTGAFQAELNAAQQLQLLPQTACTGDLVVAPLATDVRHRALADKFADKFADLDLATLSTLDASSATTLTPGRFTVRWKAVPGLRGRYQPSVGPARGAAPPSQGTAAFRVVNAAPLLRAASPQATASFFVFHVPAALRPVTSVMAFMTTIKTQDLFVPIFDMAQPFLPEKMRPDCLFAIVGDAVRGFGEDAPGPKPTKATMIVDPYGTHWTYYYDEKNQTLRTVNHGTGAARSFNYDALGNSTAVEQPLLDRACLTWDANANLTTAELWPVPNAVGSSVSVKHLFSYKGYPARLETVFDPRDPVRALVTSTYDDEGNLRTTISATQEKTTVTPTSFGLPDSIVGANLARTRYAYDLESGVAEKMAADADGPTPWVAEAQHDRAGRPVFAKSPLGETTTWSWRGPTLNAVTRDADGLRETQTFTYNADARLETSSNGQLVTSIKYDKLNHVRVVRQHALDVSLPDTVTCTLYGTDGRVLEQVLPEGNRLMYTYDGEGRVTSVRTDDLSGLGTADPRSIPLRSLGWDADCLGLPQAPRVAASGLLRKVAYDANGRPSVVRDARDQATSVVYDGFGRAAIVTLPGGTLVRTGYDALGNIVWRGVYGSAAASLTYQPPSVGDPGLVSAATFEYDASGRLKKQEAWHLDDQGRPIGDGRQTTTLAYDVPGRRQVVTDDLGARTVVEFDGLDREVAAFLPTGDVTKTIFSPDHRRVTRITPAPTPSRTITSITDLTAFGAPAVERTRDGETDILLGERLYDEHRRLHSVIGPNGELAETVPDALGRPRRQTTFFDGGVQEVLDLAWDGNGNLLSRSSDAGAGVATTRYLYDTLGRLRRLERPEGHVEEMAYEGASALISVRRDARGTEFIHQYGPQGLPYTIRARARSVAQGGADRLRVFGWDELGRLVQAVDHGDDTFSATDNIDTVLRWDSLGNKLSESDSHLGLAVTHASDTLGRPRGSMLGQLSVQRDFDGLGRLTDLRLDHKPANVTHFEYAGLGGPLSRTFGSGVSTEFQYNAFGQLAGIVDTTPSRRLHSWHWDIPADGVPRTAVRADEAGTYVSIFQVDRAGRVLAEDHDVADAAGIRFSSTTAPAEADGVVARYLGTGDAGRSYVLDGRSNWLERTDIVSGTEVSFSPDTFDAYTNIAGTVPEYDAAGALLGMGDERYSYDPWGQLVQASKGGISRRYTHDALGRIVESQDVATGATTNFGYDGPQRVLEKGPEGQVHVLVEGQGLDEHLVHVGSDGSRLYYHQERGHSVYLVTSDAGVPVEQYAYTAYGDLTIRNETGAVLTTSAVGNRFGYQGQPFDTGTGLVEMRARFYRPAWGRFVSPDPIGLAGGPNLYAFVGGATLSYWDPMGLGSRNVDPYQALHVNTPTTNSWSLVDLDNVWTDSSSSAGDRLLAFTLRTFATPAALFEVGLDAFANVPYRVFSGGHRGGELLAQGVLDAQRGDTLGAIEKFSQGSGELLLAFDDGLMAAAPLAGYMGKGATTVVQTEARATGMRVKTCLQAGCGGPGGTASTALDAVTPTAGEAAGGAARGGAGVVRVGQAGEAAVRSVADIGEKALIRVGGRGRIPDGLTSTVLSEVKNVSSLSYTQQLRDFATYASQRGLRFDLWVRPTTQMSGPLLDAIEAGAINRRFIP